MHLRAAYKSESNWHSILLLWACKQDRRIGVRPGAILCVCESWSTVEVGEGSSMHSSCMRVKAELSIDLAAL